MLNFDNTAIRALSWSYGSVANNMVSICITVVADSWGVGIRCAGLGMAKTKPFAHLTGIAILRCPAGGNSTGEPYAANKHPKTISHIAGCITIRRKSGKRAAGTCRYR